LSDEAETNHAYPLTETCIGLSDPMQCDAADGAKGAVIELHAVRE
jgi:hypothetical protein